MQSIHLAAAKRPNKYAMHVKRWMDRSPSFGSVIVTASYDGDVGLNAQALTQEALEKGG